MTQRISGRGLPAGKVGVGAESGTRGGEEGGLWAWCSRVFTYDVNKYLPLTASFSRTGTRQPVLQSANPRKQQRCKTGALCLSGAKEAAARTATGADGRGREGPQASQLYARGQIAGERRPLHPHSPFANRRAANAVRFLLTTCYRICLSYSSSLILLYVLLLGK